MVNLIFRVAKGWATLLAFALMLVATIALDRTNPKNKIRKELCCDYVATDSTLYSIGCDMTCDSCAEKCEPCVERMLARYGREHFKAHRSFIKLYDLVYPPFYAVPLTLLLAYFFPVLFPGRGGRYRWLVLLPLAAMAFDYAENFTMLSVLDNYDAGRGLLRATLEVSRVFTVLKLALLSAIMFILFFFGARALVRLRADLTGGSLT